MRRIEIHIHINNLQTRHYVLHAGESPLCFHSGFSEADMDYGWEQAVCLTGEGFSDAVIEKRKAEILESRKTFWEDLLQKNTENRVVQNGEHYIAHSLENGIGFNAAQFQINWLNKALMPSVCKLSCQGLIPQWMRNRMPDNVIISKIET